MFGLLIPGLSERKKKFLMPPAKKTHPGIALCRQAQDPLQSGQLLETAIARDASCS
jgi:hypothetical protein